MNRIQNYLPSRRWLILPPILIGVAVVAYLGSSKKPLNRIEPAESAVPLVVRRVARQAIPAVASGHGTASPRRIWSAIAELSGRIVEIHPQLRPGISVQQGETLLVIDPIDYELQVRQRQAELSQAESQLQELKLNQIADEKSLSIQNDLLQVRRADVKRFETLKGRVAASQSEYDSARASQLQQSQTVQTLVNSLSTYPAKIEAAKASVDTAKAKLEEAHRNLERTRIVAPFDGLLADVGLEVGQYVASGQTLLSVLDTNSVEIEAQFSVAQLSDLLGESGPPSKSEDLSSGVADLVPNADSISKSSYSMADEFRSNRSEGFTPMDLGLTATVTARSGDLTRNFDGTPIRFVPSLDEQTRTLGIVVRVDNLPAKGRGIDGGDERGFARSGQPLRPGAYCEVLLVADHATSGFLIPRTSVEGQTVAVLDAENRIRRRPVEIGFARVDQVLVVDGLQDGDLVVVTPPAVMFEGDLVDPLIENISPTGSRVAPQPAETRRSEKR
ncbi:HlyD family efflux transporter periplasmic adaptor subunit [Stieleria sp. TO1_6]|uniref:efflux RND transporter periplasmic adaptor subunit n=1 Tax=Stieleria tagensis TaxID=2956795 RepID=UPI00209B7622|nr:HlyD family efflux transporter periplasmic adaptor subunit [Stieleria tagensis]MCO8125402.1 HlyD family efflux transporter periplasmic adaptor subunit [Stieleria tagensis]